MSKVYLLLRENRESGPFTIDELIQQQLKPSDLIWVEGKSVAWCYPLEIDELKPHVRPAQLQVVRPANPSSSAVRTNEADRSTVIQLKEAASYQKDEIETKADEIRSKVIAFAQQDSMPYFRPAGAEPSSGAMWTRDEGLHVIHHNRKSYVTLPQLVATGLITVLLASAWYGDWSAIKVKPNMVTMAAAPAAFNEQKPAQQTPAVQLVAALDSQLNVQSTPGSEITGATPVSRPVINNNLTAPDTSNEELTKAAIPVSSPTTSTVSESATEKEEKKEAAAPVETKEEKKEPVATESKSEKKEEEKPVVEEEKEEKKKKLGQVIKGIFKKKDKE